MHSQAIAVHIGHRQTQGLDHRRRRGPVRLVYLMAIAYACGLSPHPALAFTWAELGDAGELPGTAQVVSGSGSLTSISGALTGTDDIDMYRIFIDQPTTFSVTVQSNISGNNDSQLFVFDAGGSLVADNDDSFAFGAALVPELTPGVLANQSPGDYFLTIDLFNTDPADDPITAWNSNSFLDEGPYTLFLSAATAPILTVPGVDVVSPDPAERASSTTTTPALQAQTASVQPRAISTRISSAIQSFQGGRRTVSPPGGSRPGQGPSLGMEMGTGLSAGDDWEGPWGVWGSYSRNNVRNSFVSTRFDADIDTFLAGVDTLLRDDLLIGLAAGYENQDVKTDFNQGSQDITSYTVAPYLGYVIDDHWSVDASIGYTSSDTDQDRVQGGATIKGSQDSHRWFLSTNLNGQWETDNWVVGSSVGLLYARDKLKSFTESNGLSNPSQVNRLGQIRFGGSLGYSVGAVEPYAEAYLVHDLVSTRVKVGAGLPTPAHDDNELQLGAGVRYFGSQGVSGTLGFTTVKGRNNVTSEVYALTVRVDL